MEKTQIAAVRAFNRQVTRSVGALSDSYLARGRPLGQARLIFEIGKGAEVSTLRHRLRLDSGYLSRLLRSLEAQRLVRVAATLEDGRRRIARLTPKGAAERAAYDALSDELAQSMLAGLDEARRARMVTAMAEVTNLLRAGAVAIETARPDSADGAFARNAYFAELAERFKEGFDPSAHDPAGDLEMALPQGCFLIARLDGEVVGCGGLKRLDEQTGEIKRVWTAHAARGLGIARRIMAALEAHARQRAMTRIRLDTNRALSEAQAMYRNMGYREIARYNANPYADHWFEKVL